MRQNNKFIFIVCVEKERNLRNTLPDFVGPQKLRGLDSRLNFVLSGDNLPLFNASVIYSGSWRFHQIKGK